MNLGSKYGHLYDPEGEGDSGWYLINSHGPALGEVTPSSSGEGVNNSWELEGLMSLLTLGS